MIPPKLPSMFLLGPGMGRCRHSSSKAAWPLFDWKQHLVSRLPAVFLLLRGSQLQTDVTFPQHIVLTSLTYTLFEQWAARLLNTFTPKAIPAQDGRGPILWVDFSTERCRTCPDPMFSLPYILLLKPQTIPFHTINVNCRAKVAKRYMAYRKKKKKEKTTS